MSTAGFGPPGTTKLCDQPRGHTDSGECVEPGPEADNPPMLGPAGTVHASLGDWARFAQLHLAGRRDDVKVGDITLSKATFELLHRPYDGPEPKYALGWGVEHHDWAGGDGSVLLHNGSNALWYSVIWLGQSSGVAVLVTANQASAKAKGATNDVARLLIQEFERREKSGPGR
jgi:CubicO group peptidase (beta-lactamase class C family)